MGYHKGTKKQRHRFYISSSTKVATIQAIIYLLHGSNYSMSQFIEEKIDEYIEENKDKVNLDLFFLRGEYANSEDW